MIHIKYTKAQCLKLIYISESTLECVIPKNDFRYKVGRKKGYLIAIQNHTPEEETNLSSF